MKHVSDDFIILYADTHKHVISRLLDLKKNVFPTDNAYDNLMLVVCSEGCVKFSSALYDDFGEISFDNLDWLIETLQKIKETHACKGGNANE